MCSNDSRKLLNCPFCGGEAEVVSTHYRDEGLTLWQVRCKTRPYDVDGGKECYTADSFISFDNKEQAIEAWNRRANDAD